MRSQEHNVLETNVLETQRGVPSMSLAVTQIRSAKACRGVLAIVSSRCAKSASTLNSVRTPSARLPLLARTLCRSGTREGWFVSKGPPRRCTSNRTNTSTSTFKNVVKATIKKRGIVAKVSVPWCDASIGERLPLATPRCGYVCRPSGRVKHAVFVIFCQQKTFFGF